MDAKRLISENVKGSKLTTGLSGVVMLLTVLGFDGDPQLQADIQAFLTNDAELIARFLAALVGSSGGILASVALLFARDPKQNEDEVLKKVQAEVDRILAAVKKT